LKIPQTYSQLLDVCKKAKAAGTAPVIFAGGSKSAVTFLIEGLAVPLVYGKNNQWTAKLKAGKVTFRGSSGWRQAMQRFIDMNDAGCFPPGVTGLASGPAASTLFAHGQSLMLVTTSNAEGGIATAEPDFSYSFHPLPSGSSPTETTTFISLLQAVSVNAHASSRNRAAAQTFVDFMARPAQNALFTQLTGGLSQYQIKKRQVPGFMASMAPVFAKQRYITNPYASWWNPGVLGAMQDNQIGLITGQRSIDDVLKAMDVAWKKGPD
jgi:raffinose/stachyose/melibiose transport system substrate-binding protein